MTSAWLKLVGFAALLCLAFGLGLVLGAAVDPVGTVHGESAHTRE